jgi:hypothetical protein
MWLKNASILRPLEDCPNKAGLVYMAGASIIPAPKEAGIKMELELGLIAAEFGSYNSLKMELAGIGFDRRTAGGPQKYVQKSFLKNHCRVFSIKCSMSQANQQH